MKLCGRSGGKEIHTHTENRIAVVQSSQLKCALKLTGACRSAYLKIFSSQASQFCLVNYIPFENHSKKISFDKIIIIIFINCNWVITRWQCLLYMSTNMKMVRTNMKMVSTKFKTGGLHEKHTVATWNLGNHLSICL